MGTILSKGWVPFAAIPLVIFGLFGISALPHFGPPERTAHGLLMTGLGLAIYLSCRRMHLARTAFQILGVSLPIVFALTGWFNATLYWPMDLKNPQGRLAPH